MIRGDLSREGRLERELARVVIATEFPAAGSMFCLELRREESAQEKASRYTKQRLTPRMFYISKSTYTKST